MTFVTFGCPRVSGRLCVVLKLWAIGLSLLGTAWSYRHGKCKRTTDNGRRTRPRTGRSARAPTANRNQPVPPRALPCANIRDTD